MSDPAPAGSDPLRGLAARFLPDGVSRRSLLAPVWSSVAIQLASALSGIALARGLGADARGLLAAVTLWPLTVTMLLEFGVSEYLTVETARRGLRRGAGLVRSAQRLAFLATPVAGVVAILLLWSQDRVSPAPFVITGFAFVYPLLNLRTLAYAGALNGAGHHSSFQAIRVLVPVSNAVAMVALFAAGLLTVPHALVVMVLGNWLALRIARLGFRRRIEDDGDRASLRTLLRGGVGFQASSVFANLVMRVDQLVVAAVLGDAALGLYVVAVTISSPISTLAASLAALVLPDVARGGDRRRRFLSYQAMVLVVGGVGATVLAFSVDVVVPLLFGTDFTGSVPASRYLAFAGVPLASMLVTVAALKAAGDVRGAIAGQALASACAAVGLAVVLGRSGILGAAQVSLLSYVVGATFLWARAVRSL
ncbi:MAG: lipopolysaccharide biosynthesis protein [Actinomycetes bacterium]